MDDYLQYMKTLRSQMNDVEDQAAKSSVEEQMLTSTIQTLESDLSLAKSETAKLREELEELDKAKGRICSQILDMQKRIASLESDSCMLIQSLDLIQQERDGLSAKITEKSAYFSKVFQELDAKLQEQQDWIHNHDMENRVYGTNSATTRSDEIRKGKEKNAANTAEMKHCIEQLKSRANNFKQELRAMGIEALEKELESLSSEKTGETEFLISLQDQIHKLQGIVHVIKCSCGEAYKVDVGVPCSRDATTSPVYVENFPFCN